MLEFLAATQAKRRPKAQKQEQEERRRNRDKTWGMDKERLEGSEVEMEGNREARGEECEEKEEERGI